MESEFEYIEDAGEFVSDITGVTAISTEILNWLYRNEFCVFYGTRLLPKELKSLEDVGLQPLVAIERKERLCEIFENHAGWHSVKEEIDKVIYDVGPKEKQGRREGQVHFSLSRSGLVNCFDHYLRYGSEFDQHVACRLFGDDSSKQLLKTTTTAYLVSVSMNGEDLVRGAHPHFSYQDVIEMGEIPGVGMTFLNAWAFKRSQPSFDLALLRTDCCIMQNYSTPREKILKIEEVSESRFSPALP